MTAHQYNVLRILRGEHPRALSMSEIGDRLVTRAPDTTRMLDRIVECGLARRDVPSNDRRAVHVSITEEGIRLLKKMDRPLLKCHKRQLGHMSEKELKQMVRLLEKARSPHELVHLPKKPKDE